VGCIYDMMCPFLSDSTLAEVAQGQTPCPSSLAPGETTKSIGSNSASYTIPAGSVPAGGTPYPYPDEGMVEYMPPDNSNAASAETDCFLPTAESAICTATLANPIQIG
jgi:hypothetical protein